MMKNLLTIVLVILSSTYLFSQQLSADDRLTISQSTKPYIGVYAFGYQGLPSPGYPQFQLNNYGGIPGTETATADNSILGLFAFSGHNGSAKRTVGIIRVKTMDDFAANLSSRMDFLIGPNREQRMTILGDSGYVGIGTETPTNELDVNGQIRMQTGAADGYIPVSDADGVMTWTDPNNISLWNEYGANVYRYTGNVGIGTSIPGNNLDIYQQGDASIGINGNNNANTSIAELVLKTNNSISDKLLIRKYGSNVSGTWSNGLPQANMSVVATTAGGAGSLYTGTLGNAPVYLVSDNEVAIFIDTDQKIGVNTQSPTAQMHVLRTNSGTSIYGKSTYSGSSQGIGVRGESINNPGYGYGGYFEGGAQGVHGSALSTTYTGVSSGVNGFASGSAGDRRGVTGQAINLGGVSAYGVYGYATDATSNYGVYGYATGGDESWAGYFAGDAYVGNLLEVNERVHINNDGSSTQRLAVIENANNVDAVYVKNLGASGASIGGSGLRVDAGFKGIDVNMNDADKNGSHYGYYMNNVTGGEGLTGFQYGMYSYTSGSRAANGGNYSLYAQEGGTSGFGTNWAGYFAGDVRITGTLDNASDARLKKDIEDMDNALDIIKQLKPKTYEFRTDEYPHMALDTRPQLGFIAQDMEKVLPQLVRTAIHPEFVNKEDEKSDIPNSPSVDVKSINYIGIIPVLTQGIKELTTRVEEKEETIEDLAKDNEGLKFELETLAKDNDELKSELAIMKKQFAETILLMNDKLNQIEEGMSSCCFNGTDDRTGLNTNIELKGTDIASLEQNSPNPFNEQTVIKYYIPSMAQKATMTITDIKGSPLKSVNLEKTGLDSVTINANELPVGTYIYTLYVDGRQIESKQMVLVK